MTFGKLVLEAYQWGKEAYENGEYTNPFAEDTQYYYHWQDGWFDAEAQEQAQRGWQTDRQEARAATKH